MNKEDSVLCNRVEQIIRKVSMNIKFGFVMLPSNLYNSEQIDQYTTFSSIDAKQDCVRHLQQNIKQLTIKKSFLHSDTIQYLIIDPHTVYIR